MDKYNEFARIDTYESKHKLEKRMAAMNSTYEVFVCSAAFSEYFQYSNVMMFIEYVHKDDVEKFKNTVSSLGEKPVTDVFRLKYRDGSYRYNVVKFESEKDENDPQGITLRLELADIEEVLKMHDNVVDDVMKQRVLMGIAEEYVFSYNNSDNYITIYRYEMYQRVVLYKMDIDEWKKEIINKGMIDKNDITEFEWLVESIKSYNPEISSVINSSLRTQNGFFEKLVFEGMLYSGNKSQSIIGRIYTECSVQKASMELIDSLQYDSLTKVCNKKTITEYAVKSIKERQNNKVTIVILDVDRFKDVNDTYGHLFGDKVLIRVAGKLKELVGEDGIVGRIGGDEFMIVFNGVNEDVILRSMLRSIRTQIKWEFANDFKNFQITCSIGAAICPNNGCEYEELFKKADFCLYIAKEKGRDRYVFFRDELHRKSFEESYNKENDIAKNNSRQLKELSYMSTFMQRVSVSQKEALLDVMNHMRETYRLDCINIYIGEKMKRKYTCGEVLDNSDNALYALNDDFKKLLKDKCYIQAGFVASFANEAPEFSSEMKSRGVFSTVQCIIGSKDDIRGLITFDKCGESAQWAEYEWECAVIFASFYNILTDGGRNSIL